ncbi:MAG: restriction endonuclease [Proteobacteria bacterium]|nr:restriction endonuclease [Pseudomonadota bacterium]
MGTVNTPKVESIPEKRNFVITKGTKKPDISGMMRATVIALKQLGGSGTNNEIIERVIFNEEISEKEQSYQQKGDRRTKLKYYLSWARTNLKINGDLENSKRGVWALTKKGFSIRTLNDANKAFAEATRIEKETRGDKKKISISTDKEADISLADDLSDKSVNPDDEDWKNTLLGILKGMEGYAFERLCKRLLRESGFIEVTNSKKGADGGIDGTGILRVNLVSFKICFQCKCWTDNSVGAKDIRDFRGALDMGIDKGLFITTNSFTKPARDEAETTGKIIIDLIDGERLCDLLKENNLGVQTEMVENVSITPEWFDTFNIDPPEDKKTKPKTKPKPKTKKRKK